MSIKGLRSVDIGLNEVNSYYFRSNKNYTTGVFALH